MPDREKVIKGLECCNSVSCQKCPYNGNKECNNRGFFYSQAIEDALTLLKEREAVPVDTKMIGMPNGMDIEAFCCPDCRIVLDESFHFCPNCGQAVKLDE